MRKAFARCNPASLHQSLSILSISSRVATQSSRLSRSQQSLFRHGLPTARCIHTSPFRWQQAAPRASQDESGANDGGLITKFQELEDRGVIHRNVVTTLTRDMKLETLTEVQMATINAALDGTDIIAQAKTGTGKTLAFLLPILQRIINVDPELAQRSRSRRGPRTTADDIRAIIVSPTRELAEQIAEEARKLTSNTGVIVQTAVGGTHKATGLRAIQRQGCHLLVGTPGRLKDILSDPYTRVEAPDLSALVFDEADRLLDQGFWPEIQEIMRLLPTPAEKDRQTLMFSATVPNAVRSLVRSTLKPNFQFVQCVRDDEEPTHDRVPQHLVVAKGFENSLPAVTELCSRAIEAGRQPGGRLFKAIVYFNSTAEVALAQQALRNLQNPGDATFDAFGERASRHPWAPTKIFEIHARLTQAQRTRSSDSFRNCESGILLSSDVTARGMDFPNVTHVIQVGLVSSREQYIHRVGRTARAGKEGESWLIVTEIERDELEDRLHDLPLKPNNSLALATLNLSQPADVPAETGKLLSMYQTGIKRVPMEEKSKVYNAFLGVYGWLPRKRALVQSMNRLAQYGWGMTEPPAIPPGLARKLRVDNIPGIRLGYDDRGPDSRPQRSSGGSNSYGGRRDEFGTRGDRGGRDRFGRSADRDRFGGGADRERFGGRRSSFNSQRAPSDRNSGSRNFERDFPSRRRTESSDSFSL